MITIVTLARARVLMVFLHLHLWHRYRPQIMAIASRCDSFIIFYKTGDPPSVPGVEFVHGFRNALKVDVDVVYTLTSAWLQLYAALFAALMRVPLVIRMRGDGRRMDEIYRQPLHKRVFKAVIRRLTFAMAAAIIPIAGHLGQVARSQWGRHVTDPVPNGVDLDHFRARHMSSRTVVGWVGRMMPEKNPNFVLMLKDRLPDVEFLMATGNFNYESMPEFYNRCSVIILPSLMEGFSNVLLEAYACGRPVICSPEACPEEFPGTVVELDIEKWAAALLCTSSRNYRGIAERACARLTETAAELGHTRKTVASYAVDIETKTVQKDSGKMVLSLSDGDVKFLYNLQGILGASSVSDAIEIAFRDELAAMKFKLTIWDPRKFIYRTEVKPFTFENLVTVLMEDIKSLYEDIDEYIDVISRIRRSSQN